MDKKKSIKKSTKKSEREFFILTLKLFCILTLLILVFIILIFFTPHKKNTNDNTEITTTEISDTNNITDTNNSSTKNTTKETNNINTTENPKINNTTAEEITTSTNSATNTEKEYSEETVVYKEGFYYEPISDKIKRRINGYSYKEDCIVPYENLRYVVVKYIDFDGIIHNDGELIVNKLIADDIVEIFYELYEAKYPIAKIKLIDNYEADDEASMYDNNTSCFNYRTVAGSSTLSNHSKGMAIDINPLYNPYVKNRDNELIVSPNNAYEYANRNNDFDGKITENDLCYKLFTEHGFTWGGNWNSVKDYQHFEKEIQ